MYEFIDLSWHQIIRDRARISKILLSLRLGLLTKSPSPSHASSFDSEEGAKKSRCRIFFCRRTIISVSSDANELKQCDLNINSTDHLTLQALRF